MKLSVKMEGIKFTGVITQNGTQNAAYVVFPFPLWNCLGRKGR
ncbi:hypothetical protein BPO_1489 [Bergeyella porcorum]|uniref:Uncharacterized protein n=1 Tax=Bergeyella porcorum TaxID=1735111 RepID=A0AAU0F819_9FLAO